MRCRPRAANRILAPLISDPHADAGYEAQAIGAYRAAGQIDAERGDIPKSVEQFQSALQLAARLEAVEPSNTETREMATWANFGLARTKLAANAVDEAAALITPACDATDRLIARDGTGRRMAAGPPQQLPGTPGAPRACP